MHKETYSIDENTAKRLTELDSNQTINSSHLKQAITEVDKAEFEKLSSVIKKD